VPLVFPLLINFRILKMREPGDASKAWRWAW